MIEQGIDLMSQIDKAAMQCIQNYVEGLLTLDVLRTYIVQEWWKRQERHPEKTEESYDLLLKLTLGICSSTLYAAWSSTDKNLRNLAYENMRRYLERSLRRCCYTNKLLQYSDAIDEVLNQTLFELFYNLERNPAARPKAPASFIRWTQVAALHQAHAFVYKRLNSRDDSLEAEEESFSEHLIDERHPDPEEDVIARQLLQALKQAILSLSNPSYRQVLLSLYMEGIEEKELANILGVPAKEIYVWKFRALRALRKKPEIERIRHPWREDFSK